MRCETVTQPEEQQAGFCATVRTSAADWSKRSGQEEFGVTHTHTHTLHVFTVGGVKHSERRRGGRGGGPDFDNWVGRGGGFICVKLYDFSVRRR